MSEDLPELVPPDRQRPSDPIAGDVPGREGVEPPRLVAGWAELLLEAEEAILRMLGAARPLGEVLEALCKMVEALCAGSTCTILLLEPDGRHLRRVAAPSLPAAFREAVRVIPVGPTSGSSGAAAASGETVVAEDLASDPRWARWRDGALAVGLRACWAMPVRASTGGILGTFGTFLDEPRPPTSSELRICGRAAYLAAIAIERHRIEESTRRGRERLELALEAGRMGTWEWDVPTGAISWSDNLDEVHGLPPGTFDGTFEGFRGLIHPEDRERVEAAIAEAVARRSSYEVEFRVGRPDGTVGWMLGKGRVFADGDGRPGRMIGLGMDLTDRKRAEEEIREGREQFRTLADSIPQLAWMARPDGSIFWLNRRCLEFSGKPAEELEGWKWESVLDPDHLPRVLPRFKEAIAAGEPWEDTFPLRRHDGAMRWHLSRAVPIRDEQGRVLRWFGTNTDITERKEMEAALEEADRRKDEFLAMLAHELRNPLAPIATALTMIGRAGAEGPDASEAREIAEHQVRHLGRLIDDLMDLARISRGTIEIRPERLDLVDVVRRAVGAVRSAIDERGQALAVVLADEPIRLLADATRLEQILWNLLHNASKYTERGGRIELAVAREGPEALVRVRDSGIGIDPGLLPRIFDPFVQAEIRRDRSRGGLGLGLSLVKSLVELHGGAVEARSDGPGRGSTFVVRLAIAPDAPATEPLAPPPRAGPPPGPPRRRVLVVDDNEDAAVILGRLLRHSYGQQVLVAHDGPSALEAARDFRPEVVLLDIGLPGIDGFEVARRLRHRPETRDARIIALTGWGQEQDRRRSHEAGFDHHLVKPADIAEIVRLIGEPAGPPG